MTTFEIAICASVLYVGGFVYVMCQLISGATDDPYINEEIAREQEWTVDDRELPDFDWMLAR